MNFDLIFPSGEWSHICFLPKKTIVLVLNEFNPDFFLSKLNMFHHAMRFYVAYQGK